MAKFMGFLVNVSNVDEAVQRVDGVFVIDAKAIYDLMYGAYRPLVMEKRTASYGLTTETAKAQLERFFRGGCVEPCV